MVEKRLLCPHRRRRTPALFNELLHPRGSRRCTFAVEQVVDGREGREKGKGARTDAARAAGCPRSETEHEDAKRDHDEQHPRRDRSFAKHESATRNHVRTLAERIETSLPGAIEALASTGAARVPSSATYGVALPQVTTEVWANPASTMRKRSESGGDERAIERESAEVAAEQVLTNVAPARQAPYRA